MILMLRIKQGINIKRIYYYRQRVGPYYILETLNRIYYLI